MSILPNWDCCGMCGKEYCTPYKENAARLAAQCALEDCVLKATLSETEPINAQHEFSTGTLFLHHDGKIDRAEAAEKRSQQCLVEMADVIVKNEALERELAAARSETPPDVVGYIRKLQADIADLKRALDAALSDAADLRSLAPPSDRVERRVSQVDYPSFDKRQPAQTAKFYEHLSRQMGDDAEAAEKRSQHCLVEMADVIEKNEELRTKLASAEKDAERLTTAFEPLLQMLAWNRVSGNCTSKERDAIFNARAAIAAGRAK